MLTAYTWRVYQSYGCVSEFYATMTKRQEAGAQDPYWQLGAASLATVCCCNSYWLFKVAQGVAKHFLSSNKAKKTA